MSLHSEKVMALPSEALANPVVNEFKFRTDSYYLLTTPENEVAPTSGDFKFKLSSLATERKPVSGSHAAWVSVLHGSWCSPSAISLARGGDRCNQ